MAERSEIRPGSVIDHAFGAGPIADITAPTVAELNGVGFTRIECFVVGDGTIDWPRDGETADASSGCDTENYSKTVAVTNGEVKIPMWRYLGQPGDGATDEAYELFEDETLPRPKRYIWTCRAGASGAAGVIAASDVVDIREVEVVARAEGSDGKTTLQMFDATLSVQNRAVNVTVLA